MTLPRIALDAMGGDHGVRVMIEGAALARRRHDRFQFLLVGDEERIKRALDNHPNLRGASIRPGLRWIGRWRWRTPARHRWKTARASWSARSRGRLE